MDFALLVKYFEELEKVSARNAMIDILSELFKKTGVEDIDKVCYFLLGYVLPVAEDIEKKLQTLKVAAKVSLAGSIRRKKETVHDIDVLVASEEPVKVINYFVHLPDVKRVLAKGETKSTVILANNLQVDLRVVREDSFGSALQYLTGSKEHNIKLRDIALNKNMKLSEYGLFDKKSRKISRHL